MSIDLTPEEMADVIAEASDEEKPLQRTLLEIWREILSNNDAVYEAGPSPTEVVGILQGWPFLDFSDLPQYWSMYYHHINSLKHILEDVITEEALLNVENDGVDNHDLYLELLVRWPAQAQEWETCWSFRDSDAPIRLAAMSDASQFVLGRTGLLEHLSVDRVGFVYPEAERAEVQERIAALHEAHVASRAADGL